MHIDNSLHRCAVSIGVQPHLAEGSLQSPTAHPVSKLTSKARAKPSSLTLHCCFALCTCYHWMLESESGHGYLPAMLQMSQADPTGHVQVTLWLPNSLLVPQYETWVHNGGTSSSLTSGQLKHNQSSVEEWKLICSDCIFAHERNISDSNNYNNNRQRNELII